MAVGAIADVDDYSSARRAAPWLLRPGVCAPSTSPDGECRPGLFQELREYWSAVFCSESSRVRVMPFSPRSIPAMAPSVCWPIVSRESPEESWPIMALTSVGLVSGHFRLAPSIPDCYRTIFCASQAAYRDRRVPSCCRWAGPGIKVNGQAATRVEAIPWLVMGDRRRHDSGAWMRFCARGCECSR